MFAPLQDNAAEAEHLDQQMGEDDMFEDFARPPVLDKNSKSVFGGGDGAASTNNMQPPLVDFPKTKSQVPGDTFKASALSSFLPSMDQPDEEPEQEQNPFDNPFGDDEDEQQ